MIIKVTIKDNDFTQLIERYFDNDGKYSFVFLVRLLNSVQDDTNKHMKMCEVANKFNGYIINGANKITYADKRTFERLLKQEIIEWLKEVHEDDEYIIDNLKVTITSRLISKWENGEVVYFFPSQHKYITQ